MHVEEFKDRVTELAKTNNLGIAYMFFCFNTEKSNATSRFEHANLLDMHMMVALLEREKQTILKIIERMDKNKTTLLVEEGRKE